MSFRYAVHPSIVALSTFVFAATASSAYVVELLVADGDSAPGGGTFINFASVGVDDTDRAVFHGGVASGATGIYAAEFPGALSSVAVTGGTAPDTGGGTFNFAPNPDFVDTSGNVSDWAHFSGGSATTPGVFLFAGTDSGEVFAGDPAPGTATTYSTFSSTEVNASGTIAFIASLGAGGDGLFRADAGTDTVVALPGDGVQGDPNNVGFTLTSAEPTIDDSGRVAFLDLGVSPNRVLRESGGILTVVADPSDTAPGTGGQAFGGFAKLSGNAAGDLVFTALPGGTPAIYIVRGGSPELVALSGDPAPDTGGGTFDSLNPRAIDRFGQVVFIASISGGTTASGVFVGTPTGIQAVALEGGVAPDTGGGTFSAFGSTSGSINDAGNVAFQADVSVGGVSEGVFLPEPSATVPVLLCFLVTLSLKARAGRCGKRAGR